MANPQSTIMATTPARQNSTWIRPIFGFVKCNYDCRFKQNESLSRACWILKDSNGFYLEAGQSEEEIVQQFWKQKYKDY